MGMGGGSAGAAPPAGLSPMQLQNLQQAQMIADQNMPMADVYAQQLVGANTWMEQFAKSQQKMRETIDGWNNQQRKWAEGGLMATGLSQMHKGLNGPNLTPGMMLRQSQRMGVQATPDIQAAMDAQNQLSQISNKVGINNQTRQGLATASRGLKWSSL